MVMLLRIGVFGVLAMALAVGATPGQDKKDTATAKTKEVGGITGKVKDIDVKKKSFSITLADKSDKTFLVNKDTKFLGPRGAEHEEGLSDPAMVKGAEVRVVPAKDEKYAKEVNLPGVKAGGKKKG